MKKYFLLTVLASIILFSCTPSDSNSNSNTTSAADYLPLKISNYWTYNVDNNVTINRDSIYVEKDTTINNFVYKKIASDVTPTGFMSNSLNNNSLRLAGNQILMTGKPNLSFIDGVGLDLSLTDFVVFKSGASANETLSTVSGTINQVYNNYPLKIDYTLKSVAQADLPTYTSSNNATFTDVKAVKTILNIKVTAVLVPPFTSTILEPQDVIVSTQYFAKNIGVVHANTTSNYTLTSGLGSLLNIPESGNQVINEYLATKKVD